MKSFLALLFVLIISFSAQSQDLLGQLENQQSHVSKPVTAMFKGTRIFNGQSIELRGQGNLDVIISHRFGRLNSGGYNFFGLDDSNVRLGLEYAVLDRLTLGFGRNSVNKVYDGFVKGKLLEQKTIGSPLSIVWMSDMSIYTLKRPELNMTFQRRLRYVHQVLLARKFSPGLSLQLMPSLVHHNLVESESDPNNLAALGLGGRVALSKRVSLTGEYYYRFGKDLSGHNSLGIGVDIETGGHVFQLHFTNSNEMTPSGFIPSTQGNFFDGDIHFGFNIVRSFTLKHDY
ncbi:DUF5777 family beta-barrel protein [Algoriphagus zhangzhouensis]|uniref:DUF5777 domain-containing protein n=2 Tax=Algoriphagus zhangzhouensis TaxID=1073327 RepID=A0A1M7ZIR4_9BACT|nr:DUF5777 family beta-barrel protein [Algoriphagus zhangzhouensis]TDY44329.1 hypothetical protein A8938_3542 [Algoriphagus zhangzhouensis]SHO64566.1 hypothetical protein SAMN04488108_3537 [Algoriphagus zhangzhouensis]